MREAWGFVVAGFSLAPHHLVLALILAVVAVPVAMLMLALAVRVLLFRSWLRALEYGALGLVSLAVVPALPGGFWYWEARSLYGDLRDPELRVEVTDRRVELVRPRADSVRIRGEVIALPPDVVRSWSPEQARKVMQIKFEEAPLHMAALRGALP